MPSRPRLPLRHTTVAKPVSQGFASGKGWWIKFTSTTVRGNRHYEVVWHRTGNVGFHKRHTGPSLSHAREAFARYVAEASKVK